MSLLNIIFSRKKKDQSNVKQQPSKDKRIEDIILRIEKYNEQDKKFSEQVDRNIKGIKKEKLKKVDEAIIEYEKNIKDGFEGNHPYDRLAIIYRKRKEYMNEIRALERGIEVFSILEKTTKRLDVTPKLTNFKLRLEKTKVLQNKTLSKN